MSSDDLGNESSDPEWDDAEYNGTEFEDDLGWDDLEWDDAYDPDSDFWTTHDAPDDSDKEWDGAGNTAQGNSWDAAATVGSVAPENETKAQRKARQKAERKAYWQKTMQEARIEAEQKKLKQEELAFIARAERWKRAEAARKEAERRGFVVKDWEEAHAKQPVNPRHQKEVRIARVITGVGIAAALLGGVIGWHVSPAETVTETETKFIDTTPSLDTRANNRANEILAERGHAQGDSGSCKSAVEAGIKLRDYMQRHEDAGAELGEYVKSMYSLTLGHEPVGIGDINEIRLNLADLSKRNYGLTTDIMKTTRSFNYHADKCGVETNSEFSEQAEQPDNTEGE